MLRRNFIKLSATAFATTLFSKLTYAAGNGASYINNPDEAWAQVNDQWVKLNPAGAMAFAHKDIHIQLKANGNAQAVYVQSPTDDLQAIKLVWKFDTDKYAKVLGDHWERSYGDLAWRSPEAGVRNPWYVLLNAGTHTACFGVKTGCNSMAWWGFTSNTLELVMDTRSGGSGVKLGHRQLHAANVVTMHSSEGQNAYHTATAFCKVMCDKPRLPKQPVYGINDWYAVYGNNSSQTITDQTKFMMEMVTDTGNKPFSVIDDGWEQPDDFFKPNDKFKDMARMADVIKGIGMRPGLWTRVLIAHRTDKASLLAPKIPGRDDPNGPILDPTVPEVLERIKQNMMVYRQWGYEMVKHDYTNWDIFGRWGMQMKDSFTAPGWKFYDQTHTNAEIINKLYGTIREGAGDMYIIGCNTLSHLSAGVFELNRTGDDTSGKEWARTKKMGVNTLGFRLPQNKTFYAADGDCVGITHEVAWEKNKQWLQLLAESGAPLFISSEISFIGAEQKTAIKQAFAQAAKVQPTGEPLDWMTNQFPEKWKLNGRQVDFSWD